MNDKTISEDQMKFCQIQFRRGLQRLYLCGSILWLVALALWFPWRELRKAPVDYDALARQAGGSVDVPNAADAQGPWQKYASSSSAQDHSGFGFSGNATPVQTPSAAIDYGNSQPANSGSSRGWLSTNDHAVKPDLSSYGTVELPKPPPGYTLDPPTRASDPDTFMAEQAREESQRAALIQLLCLAGAPVIGYALLFHVGRWIYRGFVNA